jgi:hypothetical protein
MKLARHLARIAVETSILCSEPQHVKYVQLALNAQVNQLCQSNALMVNFQQQVLQVVEIVIIARVSFAKMEVFKVTRISLCVQEVFIVALLHRRQSLPENT